jgi:hypothetical protein
MDDNTNKAVTSAKHLFHEYHCFLRRFGLNPHVYKMDYYALNDVARRYWRDVNRLHSFHDMKRINGSKIAGYYAYWICKLRPICVGDRKEYINRPGAAKFINETFALHIACGRINADLQKKGGSTVKIDGDTLDTLLYSLRYRVMPGDALSLFFDTVEKMTAAGVK